MKYKKGYSQIREEKEIKTNIIHGILMLFMIVGLCAGCGIANSLI